MLTSNSTLTSLDISGKPPCPAATWTAFAATAAFMYSAVARQHRQGLQHGRYIRGAHRQLDADSVKYGRRAVRPSRIAGMHHRALTLGVSGRAVNCVPEADAAQIAEMLRLNSTLLSLNLFRTSSGWGAAGIARAVLGRVDWQLWLSTSTVCAPPLSPSGNCLGTKGVVRVAEGLQANTTLTTLNIGGAYSAVVTAC